MLKSGRFKQIENVEYVLRDSNGNIKKIFNEYKFARILRKIFNVNLPQISLFGSYKNSLQLCNLVTSAGKAGVSAHISGVGSPAAYTYIAIGTGTTAANVADTTLQTEITTNGGQRASATMSQVTTTVTNDTAQAVLTFNFTGSFAVTESGLLNAASSGTLLARQVFSAINVANGDSLQVTWKIQAS